MSGGRRLRTSPSRLIARPWLLAFVPVNAATSGFGVVLPLLILISLHRAWTDVALAATLFNGAVILASVAWGWVADRYPSRRALLVINFAGFAVLYSVLPSAHSLGALLTIYALVGVLTPAGSNASNLLILESFGPTERPSAYASFQLMSMLGAIGGLLGGYLWLAGGRPLGPLLFVLAGLAAVSALGVAVGIATPRRSVPSAHIGRHLESFASRLRHLPSGRTFVPFFPVHPTLSRAAFRRFGGWMRAEGHHELPLILGATFLFNLSSNLFNISYTPYLYSVGIGAASIFLVNLANNGAQAAVYPASGTLTGRIGADRLVERATYVRSLGYLGVAGFTFVPLVAAVALLANVVAFGVLGVAIAFYTTASSILLFRALDGRDAGKLLGLASALGGLAAVAGAGLSGVLSVFGSFRLVFLVSAGALLASIPIWTAASVAFARRHATPPASPEPAPPPAPSPVATAAASPETG